MCRERALAERHRADSGLSLEERAAGRANEQQWLQFARLYQLMDEMLASLGPPETDQQQSEEVRDESEGGPQEPSGAASVGPA